MSTRGIKSTGVSPSALPPGAAGGAPALPLPGTPALLQARILTGRSATAALRLDQRDQAPRPTAPAGPATATAQLGDTTQLDLAAVLDHLYRPEGKALVDRLMVDLQKAGLDVRTLPTPGGSRQYDVLLDYVAEKQLPVDPYVLQRFRNLRETALQFPDLEKLPFRRSFALAAQPTQTFHQVLMVHAYAVFDSVLRMDAPYIVDAALPQVVISALGEAADARGKISVDRAQQILGPRAANFLRAVQHSMGTTPVGRAAAPRLAKGVKYTHLSPSSAVMTQLGASKPAPTALAARMPVLRELAAHLPADFSRFEMVAVQHLFPTTGVLFDTFAEHGVDPTRSSVLGKNYSADPEVMVRLHGGGWSVVAENIKPGIRQEPGEVFGSLDRLPEEIRFHADAQVAPVYHRLAQLFEGVDPAKTDRRFLLLDEGGKLVKLLHTYFPAFAPLCVAVEQTDRGIQEVEKIDLKCPVINVARSAAKKTWESPMIGENVVAAALAQIQDLHPSLEPSPKVASIIGYGAVGKASADALRRRGYTVHVHDTDPAKLAAARKDGCQPATREEALAKGALLISATGRTTLEPADYDLLPRGAILVNAASGNHELGAHLISEVANQIEEEKLAARGPLKPFEVQFLPDLDERPVHPYEDGQDTLDDDGQWRTSFAGRQLSLGSSLDDDQMRHRVVRTPAGNEVLLIRSGYVVNLSDDIPPEFIQLTRSLIYAACAQATKAKTPGLIALDQSAQDFIVKRTHAHLAKAKLSLAAPDFRKL